MKAEPVIAKVRTVLGEGQFTEIVVWRVPHPLFPSDHLFKYRLQYVEDGRPAVRFDNEKGKGDHMHFGDTEITYEFSGVDTLLDDFANAVDRWRLKHDADRNWQVAP